MTDYKDQIYSTVSGDKDFFKKILSSIPGFKGYVERQVRRDSEFRDTINRFEN
jgi:hypothetical protein